MTDINQKYIGLCKRFGVAIDIEDDPNVTRSRTSETVNGTALIKMNSAAFTPEEYEIYLAFHVYYVLMPHIVIETERLIIRRFNDGDKENCLPLLSNEKDAYMDCCRVFKEKDSDYYKRVSDFIENPTQYAVTLKSDGTLIGVINIFADNSRAVEAKEIGFDVVHEYQRQGYATEMLTPILDLLQRELKVELVVAGILPENTASAGLLKKLGFKAEGIHRKAVWHEMLEKPLDLLYFYKDNDTK